MSGEPEQGPVLRLGDLRVVIAPGLTGNGTTAKILVVDVRCRRTLIRLPAEEAAAFGIVIRAKAAAAGADYQAAEFGEPEGGDARDR